MDGSTSSEKKKYSTGAVAGGIIVAVVAIIIGWILVVYVIIPSAKPKVTIVNTKSGRVTNAQKKLVTAIINDAVRGGNQSVISPEDAVDMDEGIEIPVVNDAVDAIDPAQISGTADWALTGAPLDEIDTFEVDPSLAESDSADTAGDILRMRKGVQNGMRSSFLNGNGDVAGQLGINVPTAAGSRWAQQNERLLALHDGFNQRRTSRVLGVYTDLRPQPPRIPDYNQSRLLLWGISESQTTADGAMPPGGIENSSALPTDESS